MPHELAMPRPPVGRLKLRRHREATHHLRHRAIDEVVALQFAEDRTPVPAKHPRHLVGGDLRRPPAFDLPALLDAQLRVSRPHPSTPSIRQAIVKERKSQLEVARTRSVKLER
jgi:hypothetical protein